MKEEGAYDNQYDTATNVKLRDLEEKQRILKRRILLIGQNLIDLREKSNEEMLEMKKALEEIKETTTRTANFTKNILSELSKFARKDDLDILAKQAKMFQPLNNPKKK